MFLRRSRPVLLALLLALSSSLAVLAVPWTPAADAASVVPTATCRALDPNLVHGMCLKYAARSGTAFTWVGTLRAANGRVFFCIDYLYGSRIAGSPSIVSTHGLVNQLGGHVGASEVAALNRMISTWGAHGSTGSDQRDAAIALIIREVMSDGVSPDGTVVYPGGLHVGGTVRAPVGGLAGPVLGLARSMWATAAGERGPWRLTLTATRTGALPLGTSRSYLTSVVSGAAHWTPGARVSFSCTGPITCPRPLVTGRSPSTVSVTPSALGTYTIRATTTGPAADGSLYRVGSWRTHAGGTARDNGTQRGWIAQSTTAQAAVSASSLIVKGTPAVVTRASTATAVPGAALRDLVTVSGLPAGYDRSATASLYGPFEAQPGAGSCTPDHLVGTVSFPVTANGTSTTPAISATGTGYYVWTESLVGDDHTNPVSTPCGLSAETTLVRRTVAPQVHTVASHQHVLLGGRVHDDVMVSGLPSGTAVPVGWTLLGPLAPRSGSCTGLDWSRARVLAAGSISVTHNGTWQTADTVLTSTGCFTYAEHLAGSATSSAVSTRPGARAETVLATRPVTRVVPEIPSGPFSAGTR